MSAEVDLLRRAEGMLRERANAATSGPWRTAEDWAYVASGGDSVIHGYYEGDCPACGDEIKDDASVAISAEDATYIATMHPGVGLALADWLHAAGADLWAHGPLCECGTGCDACDDNLWEPHVRAALALARLIVGAR